MNDAASLETMTLEQDRRITDAVKRTIAAAASSGGAC
jgi:hypothetical protein